MTVSTMLQSKISRTRKRLSSHPWQMPVMVIAFSALLIILTYGFQTVSLSWTFDIVPTEFPVMSEPVPDPSQEIYREQPESHLAKRTPVVVLTADALYFGDLHSLTVDFLDVRNKFIVPHDDGRPRLNKLLDDLEGWAQQRFEDKNVVTEGVAILAPSGDIPVPIVIQVIAGLRESPIIDRVVLAGGII